MAHQVTWLAQKKLLYLYMYDVISHDDLLQIIGAMEQTSPPPHPFFIVADGIDIKWNNFRAADLSLMFQHVQPMKNATVLSIQPSRLNRFLSDLIFRVVGIEGRIVITRQEAFEWLALQGVASYQDLESQHAKLALAESKIHSPSLVRYSILFPM